jgi:mono/diheme cytochrome c family protein
VAVNNPLTTPFRAHCAACHDTTLPHPPNFLHGAPDEVETKLDHCAERIFVRLNRAKMPVHDVSPMPPAAALAARGIDSSHWANSPELAKLSHAIEARLHERDTKSLLRQPYASLRACLPTYPSHDANTTRKAHAPSL